MVIAIHSQLPTPVPPLQGAVGNDRDGVAVRIVVRIIDVLEASFLFLLDIAIQRASADHVQHLRSPADGENR